MKLNRRKAMAAIVGGASTAPQAARSAMQNLGSVRYATPTSDSTPEPDYGGAKQAYDPIQYAQKLAQEKERLTKIANGDFSGCWEEGHIKEIITQHKRLIKDMHVDTFRSVSHCNKERIKLENSIEETKNHWMESAKKQLLALFNKKPGDIF